jgi:hypothetical protein
MLVSTNPGHKTDTLYHFGAVNLRDGLGTDAGLDNHRHSRFESRSLVAFSVGL